MTEPMIMNLPIDLMVWAPGSFVKCGLRVVMVTGIQIRDGGYITYHVVWWDGDDRKEQWVNAIEITDGDDSKCWERSAIGFRRNGNG